MVVGVSNSTGRRGERETRAYLARVWGDNPVWKVFVPVLSVIVIVVCALVCVATNIGVENHKAVVERSEQMFDARLRDVVGPASDLASRLGEAWSSNDADAARQLLAADSVSRTSVTTQSGGEVRWLGGALVSGDHVRLRLVALADGAIDTVVYGSTPADASTVSVEGVASTSGVKAPVTGSEHDEVVYRTNEVMDMVQRLRETQGKAPTMDPSDMEAIAAARAQARAEAEGGA
jgi:hypothetical protein